MNDVCVQGKMNFMGIDIPIVSGGFGEGKMCITDKTIAEIHGQPTIEIRKTINRNIKRFKEGIDHIDLKIVSNEITNNLLEQLGYSKMQISKAEHIYLLSERGYAKLIKIMDDDKSWEVHDKLVDDYFNMKENIPQLTEREKAILMVMNAKGEMEKTNALAYLEAAVTKPLLDTIEELEEKLRQQKLGVDGIYTGDDVIQFLKNEKLINSMCTVTWLNEYLATLGYMSKASYFYEPTYKFKKELADEGYAYTRTTGGGNQRVLYRVDFIHLLISEHLEDLQAFMDVKVKTFSTKQEDEAKAKREQRRIKKEQEEKEKMEKKQNKKVIAKSLTEPKVLVFKNANQTEKYGFTRNAVYKCLRGERKSHNGYTWEFLNKVEE